MLRNCLGDSTTPTALQRNAKTLVDEECAAQSFVFRVSAVANEFERLCSIFPKRVWRAPLRCGANPLF